MHWLLETERLWVCIMQIYGFRDSSENFPNMGYLVRVEADDVYVCE